MDKTRWTEEKLIDMLKQMPQIDDSRNPSEIYSNIAPKLPKKKRFAWLIPTFASAAAIVLLMILVPNLSTFNKSDNPFDTAQELNMEDKSEKNADNLMQSEEKLTKMDEIAISKIQVERTAVYPEDLDGQELLLFAIPDQNAQNIVPISILVNKEESKNWFEQFVETMPKLTEEAWGLSEYYPLDARLSYEPDQKIINIDLPRDHKYGMGSASEIIFKNSLILNFKNRKDVHTLVFSTDKQLGVETGNDYWDKINLRTDVIDVQPYFPYYVEGNSTPFLVPLQESTNTIEEAIEVMKKEFTTHELKPAIPKELKIEDVVANNETLTIYIRKGSEIPQSPEMVYALEAVLLTAKEFGFSHVVIKNGNLTYLGPFRLDEPIEVPISANKQVIL